MTRKAFDIMPPVKKLVSPMKPETPKKAQKNSLLFLLFVLAVLIFSMIYLGKNYQNSTGNTSSTNPNNFEYFSPTGGSNFAETQTYKVRMINASGKTDVLEKAQKTLTKPFILEQAKSTEDLVGETTIYYPEKLTAVAQDLKNQLAQNQIEAKLMVSTDLGTTYALLLVIGQK